MSGSIRKLIAKRKRNGRTVRARNKALDKKDKENTYTETAAKKYGKAQVFYRQLLRGLVEDQIREYKHNWYVTNKRHDGLYECELTHKLYKNSEIECDHYEPKFRDIAHNFAIENNLTITWDLFKSKVHTDPFKNVTRENKKLMPVQQPESPNYADFIKSIPFHGNTKSTFNQRKNIAYTHKLEKKMESKQLQLKNNVFIDKTKQYYKEFLDTSLNQKFIDYHKEKANLRMIYWKKNRELL